jgi:hypothetical protein
MFTKKTYLQKVIQVNKLKVHFNKENKHMYKSFIVWIGIGFGNKTVFTVIIR